MIDTILLDGNRTIENASSLTMKRESVFQEMARNISEEVGPCNADQLLRFHAEFSQQFGEYIWEYHLVFWRTVLKRLSSHKDIGNVLQRVYTRYLSIYERHIELFDDVIPFLETQSRKRKLGFVANGNEQRLQRLVERYKLNRFFSVVAISGEGPFKKPESFLFEYALKSLGTQPEHAVMIGDRYSTDIFGAKKLSLRTIHILRRNVCLDDVGSPCYCPDALVRSLSEVETLLEKAHYFGFEKVFAPPEKLDAVVSEAVIVCGGRGTRMKGLAMNQQKCSLEVGGIPIIEHLVRTLGAVGCRKVYFLLKHKGNDIRSVVGDGSQYHIEPVFVETESKSTLSAVLSCIDNISGSFYYLHGNILYPPRLLELLFLKYSQLGTSTVVLVPDDNRTQHSRMMRNSNSIVMSVDLSGVPNNSSNHFLFMGLAIYQKELFVRTFYDVESKMTEEAVGVAVRERQRIGSLVYEGPWRHYETEQDYVEDSRHTPAELISW